MSASLVGSEMCIRDRPRAVQEYPGWAQFGQRATGTDNRAADVARIRSTCLLYTSDAADDM
eukprot:1375115-Alexandrium_andersonii.AAC.1